MKNEVWKEGHGLVLEKKNDRVSPFAYFMITSNIRPTSRTDSRTITIPLCRHCYIYCFCMMEHHAEEGPRFDPAEKPTNAFSSARKAVRPTKPSGRPHTLR